MEMAYYNDTATASTPSAIGFLPTEPNEMAATMISFFQQFQQYIPCDIAPLHPRLCQKVLAKLIVLSEPNKVCVNNVTCTTVISLQNLIFKSPAI